MGPSSPPEGGEEKRASPPLAEFQAKTLRPARQAQAFEVALDRGRRPVDPGGDRDRVIRLQLQLALHRRLRLLQTSELGEARGEHAVAGRPARLLLDRLLGPGDRFLVLSAQAQGERQARVKQEYRAID